MPGVKGKSGGKPKPTAKKLLAGNPGKRALNTNEPSYSELTNIDCPDWIKDEGRQIWEVLAPELCREKVLSITDIHNLEAFCAAYSRWRIAERDVVVNGIVVAGASGSPIKNPAVTVINEALKQMSSFGAALGLDPSSRQRLTGGGKNSSSNPFDAL